ncbi:hypothetical protein BH09PAT1_BH09PAT1_0660 [soil metagenome]
MNREKAYAYLKAVWPTVYRIINGGLYFILGLIRTFFKVARDEITGKGGF